MTGVFAPATRASVCVSFDCQARIQTGELVYLFRGIDRQTVCLACAKRRWDYAPADAVDVPTRSKSAPESIGFDSAKTILQRLQRANVNDPKMRAAGDR